MHAATSSLFQTSADPSPTLETEAGFASLAWSMSSDRIVFSDNAAAVLQIDPASLPGTGRAFHRLFTPDTQGARTAVVPALGPGPDGADRSGTYCVRYRLRAGDTPIPGVVIEERGRWRVDAAGRPVSATAILYPVDAPADRTAAKAASAVVSRDDLLADLAADLSTLVRDRQGTLGFVIIALDDLAGLNRHFGFETGDRIIEAVGQRIARRLRGGDILGRLSGHKFGAVLRNCSETALAVAADRFRDTVGEEPVAIAETRIRVSASVGAILAPRHAPDLDAALGRAEEALDAARHAGRGQVRVYAPSTERDRLRRRNLDLAGLLQDGLDEARLAVAWQPVVETATRAVVGHEALARVRAADGAFADTRAVVDLAARLDLADRLDGPMLRRALAVLRADPAACVSINISAATLAGDGWLAALEEEEAAAPGLAGRLTVEIAEAAVLGDHGNLRPALDRLAAVGCPVALDDVGAAGLQAFGRVPVAMVKIEAGLVRAAVTHAGPRAVIRAIVEAATAAGAVVVGKGVECEDAAAMLAACGVARLQGHLSGAPVVGPSPAR
ncbi:EAL domain-containing protein [Chthonobacter rhizosphaerae]|uniref:EAL domain-containing protein n=1 Tax=Chthonobacter rhizosphaerae TaxID=2735553 RepID=UPI0015EEA620|nr:GGDEF and EAL domain-containing protein [Chthonobacter rhizosphaerae]